MDPAASPLQPPDPPDRDTPPILTIHGDADPIVLSDHATRLHELLDEWGVPNQLITIEGSGHGGFSPAENRQIYAAIQAFLGEHGLGPQPWND